MELRREWDSNPRYSFPHTRFPSVRLKPLGHLSGCPLLKGRDDFCKWSGGKPWRSAKLAGSILEFLSYQIAGVAPEWGAEAKACRIRGPVSRFRVASRSVVPRGVVDRTQWPELRRLRLLWQCRALVARGPL